jgi:hypothetical protein
MGLGDHSVADERSNQLAVEIIPDAHNVLMRAHREYFSQTTGELQPGVFQAKEDEYMSVDWEKYSTPQATRQRARNPERNAVISLLARGIRDIDSLDVIHKPEPDNCAHSGVVLPGNREELAEIRVLLLRIAQIVLPIATQA